MFSFHEYFPPPKTASGRFLIQKISPRDLRKLGFLDRVDRVDRWLEAWIHWEIWGPQSSRSWGEGKGKHSKSWKADVWSRHRKTMENSDFWRDLKDWPKGSVTCCFSNSFLLFFLVPFLSTNVVTPLEFIYFLWHLANVAPRKVWLARDPRFLPMESQEWLITLCEYFRCHNHTEVHTLPKKKKNSRWIGKSIYDFTSITSSSRKMNNWISQQIRKYGRKQMRN